MASAGVSRAIDIALWAFSVVWMGLVVAISLFVRPPPFARVPQSDKALHALAYGMLTVAVLLAAVWRPGRGPG
ncbi:MAG: hypothetical protein M3245_02050, partial [Actinomycetota bacterium]|nr:hypothetical protein [Actinomycetota bacterium]